MTKLYNSDCLEQLKEIEENSVDTIITDPPYGLSFMGKKWDYDVPNIEIWKECLRVLKPGGTALIFAGSRTQHRMACNVEDAGFILKDCIMWLYGSGFPKATDISKQLDKGHKREVIGDYVRPDGSNPRKNVEAKAIWNNADGNDQKITEPSTPEAKLWNGWKSHGLKPAYEPILVAQKPNEGTYANNALKWGVSGLNIDGSRIGTDEDLGREQKEGPLPPKYGFNNNKMGNRYQPGNPQGRFPANIVLDEEAGKMLDEQSGIEASRFFYTAKASKLKPAYEPILVAQKPNDGTYANNALVWGVSGLNIDGGRITYQSEDDKKKGTPASLSKNRFTGNSYNNGNKGHLEVMHNQSPQGRFPANIILDEEAGEMLDEQSGELSVAGNKKDSILIAKEDDLFLGGMTRKIKVSSRKIGDKGGASRFFYCAKASKAERNAGGDNNHPTVKPLKLMEYLCTLTKTPTGGIVLDPFMGSGTTGVASVNTGRDFIGIERKVEYFKIAEARIRFASSQTKLSI